MTEYRLCYLTLQYFLGPRILLELTKELKRSKEERQNVDFTGRFRPIVFLTLSLPAVSTSDNSTQTLSPWIFATQKSLFPGEICILKFTNCSSTLKVANLILKRWTNWSFILMCPTLIFALWHVTFRPPNFFGHFCVNFFKLSHSVHRILSTIFLLLNFAYRMFRPSFTFLELWLLPLTFSSILVLSLLF
jgi:hypothetical protein